METPRDQLVSFVLSRFSAGLGAELFLNRRGEDKVLILVPSTLFSTRSSIGLAIACEDEGFLLWDGKNPLNAFDLVASGFSLMVSEAVATLVRDLFPCRVRRKLTNNPRGLLTNGVSQSKENK